MDTSAVDAFFADSKSLRGPPPEWQQSSRPAEYEATWTIEGSIGDVAGALRFKCPKAYRSAPSVSVVVQGGLLVYRLDLDAPGIRHNNLPDAHRYGLPPFVDGPHIHGWEDNRSWVAANRFGELPYRRPLPPQVRRLPQALLWLGDAINLKIGHDQRGFDVPAQSELPLQVKNNGL